MTFSPDDLPRSPTGRIPQWVQDEAQRVRVDGTAEPAAPLVWRQGPPPPPPALRPRSQSRPRENLLPVVSAVLAVAIAAVSVTHWLGQQHGNGGGLGHDYSAVVQMRTPAELPAATGTDRVNPPAGFEETGGPLGTPLAPPTSSTSFVFLELQDHAAGGDTPVAWSPCRPIHVVVNPDGAPARFVDDVVASLGAVSMATGLVFAYDGLTDEAAVPDRTAFQPARYGDRWAPVLIEFSDAATVPGLDGSVVGQASPQIARDPYQGTRFYVSGRVYLDSELLAAPGRGGAPAYVPVLRHELGHLVGLDHVKDRSQLMYRTTGAAMTFQAGDLAGLAQLGHGACAPWV